MTEVRITDSHLFARLVNDIDVTGLKGYETTSFFGDIEITLEPSTPRGLANRKIFASGEFASADYEKEFGFKIVEG